MISLTFANSVLVTLLLCSDVFGSTITPAPKATCAANCTIKMQAFEHWFWQSIVLTTTYTHTIILIVDEEHHTTLTSTKLVAIPASENLNKPYPTNAEGTVTTKIASHYPGTTILAYPTEFIDYPAGYPVSGTFNSSGKCYTNPSITWKTQDLTSLTQPPVSTPSGGDKFGTLYTIAGTIAAWPSGWLESRFKDTLPTGCGLASFAPESAVQGALLLTTTSISTLKNTNTKTSSPTSITSPTTTPKGTTPFAVQDSSKTSTSKTPTPTTSIAPIVIGSTTVPVSLQQSKSGTSSQAIVIGTQTVVLGSTVTVGGMTVVATTGSDAAPQIVYDTTTIVVAPATSSTDSGMGSYIMSGISGPETSLGASSRSGASSTTRGPSLQTTGAAVRVGSGVQRSGVWYTLIMALLSLF